MSVLNLDQQQHISSAYQHAAELEARAATIAMGVEEERGRPFMMLRPRLYPDGNKWCALYGDNLQEGVAGFGDTPELAAYDFDKSWYSYRLPSPKSQNLGTCDQQDDLHEKRINSPLCVATWKTTSPESKPIKCDICGKIEDRHVNGMCYGNDVSPGPERFRHSPESKEGGQ